MPLSTTPDGSVPKSDRKQEYSFLFHSRQSECLHRLEKIRGVLSSVISSRNSVNSFTNFDLELSSHDCAGAPPDTNTCDLTFTSAGGFSPPLLRKKNNVLSPSISSGTLSSNGESNFGSECHRRLREAQKEITVLQREKNALYLLANEREKQVDRLLFEFKTPLSACSCSGEKDADTRNVEYRNSVTISSLQKVAIAAWNFFLTVNRAKVMNDINSSPLKNGNDNEAILKLIEDGGDEFNYFVQTLEEWSVRIPHFFSCDNVRYESTDTARLTELKNNSLMIEKQLSEASEEFLEGKDSKLQEIKVERIEHRSNSSQNWTEREESLMENTINLKGERQDLKWEKGTNHESPPDSSVKLSLEGFPHNGSKENEKRNDALGLMDLLKAAERQRDEYGSELQTLKTKCEELKKEREKYFHEVQDLTVALAQHHREFHESQVRWDSLIQTYDQEKREATRKCNESYERAESLEEEIKMLKRSIQKTQEDWRERQKKDYTVILKAVSRLASVHPKKLERVQKNCDTLDKNEEKFFEDFSDNSLATVLNYLQETLESLLEYFPCSDGVVKLSENIANQKQLFTLYDTKEGVSEVKAERFLIPPAFRILDAYLRTSPLNLQYTEEENQNADSETGEVNDPSALDDELLVVSGALQTAYERQSGESVGTPIVTVDMLVGYTCSPSGVFFKVGGAIVIEMGLMNPSNQQQWQRLLRSTQRFLDFFGEHHCGKECLQALICAATNSVLMSYSILKFMCLMEETGRSTHILLTVLVMLFTPISCLCWELDKGTLSCDKLSRESTWKVIRKIIEDSEENHTDNDSDAEKGETIFSIRAENRMEVLNELREVLCGDWHRGLLVPLALLHCPYYRNFLLSSDPNLSTDSHFVVMGIVQEIATSFRDHSVFFRSNLCAPFFLRIFTFLCQISMNLDMLTSQLQRLQLLEGTQKMSTDREKVVTNALYMVDVFCLSSFSLLSCLSRTIESEAPSLVLSRTHPQKKGLVQQCLFTLVPFFLRKRSSFFESWMELHGLSKKLEDVQSLETRISFISQCSLEEWCQNTFLTRRNIEELRDGNSSTERACQDHRIKVSENKGTEDDDSVAKVLESLLSEILTLYKENKIYREYLEEFINAINE